MTGRRLAPTAAPPCRCRCFVAALATLAWAAGCAAPGETGGRVDAHHPPTAGGQALRERALQAEWRGKRYDHLVESLGSPLRKLAIPGRDPSLTWAVFYGIRDARAGCFDAFTIAVVEGEQRVVDYFCR